MVAKITLEEFPIMSLAFLRFALSCALLVPFLAVFDKKELRVKLKHIPKLLIAGLLIVTFNIAFFYEGLKRTSAIDASVLSMSIPIISVLLGWLILKEKVFWFNLLGVILGLLGTVVILGLPLIFVGSFSSEGLLGNLLILLSCLSFVIGSIFAKQLLKDYHPILFTLICFLIGSVIFLVPALLDYVKNPIWTTQVSILGILGLLYIIILSSIVAFFLMSWGLEKIGVIKANLFQYVEPAIAATLAAPLLGERISFSFIIGACLIVLGVYWGTLGREHHHHILHKHHRS